MGESSAILVLLEGHLKNNNHKIERDVYVHPGDHNRLMEALAPHIEDFNNEWPGLFREITWRKL